MRNIILCSFIEFFNTTHMMSPFVKFSLNKNIEWFNNRYHMQNKKLYFLLLSFAHLFVTKTNILQLIMHELQVAITLLFKTTPSTHRMILLSVYTSNYSIYKHGSQCLMIWTCRVRTQLNVRDSSDSFSHISAVNAACV